jgi:DNA modification methylase
VSGEPTGRLILGDNLPVMAALLPTLEGRVDLIYTDPPFGTGKAYAARVGRNEDSRRPADWQLTHGYQDTWPDVSAYLDMLAPRLDLMHRLLSPSGVLYLHLDWHAAAYARLLLDEIFGAERLINEIIWVYHGPSPIRIAFKRKHDIILVYAKSRRYTFNSEAVRVPYDPLTLRTFASSRKAGFGKVPDLARGKVPEDWWYFPVVARLHKERTGYPTQKPEALIERIVLASSNPGELVADFFCGSGTAPTIASRLRRRWLAVDCSRLAVQTTHRRLLLQTDGGPFEISEASDAAPAGGPLSPQVAATVSGRCVTLRLEGVQAASGEQAASLDDVDLWEADWGFQEGVFQSRAQAVRPWRSANLPLALDHEYPEGGPHRIAVRVADRISRSGQALIEASLPG